MKYACDVATAFITLPFSWSLSLSMLLPGSTCAAVRIVEPAFCTSIDNGGALLAGSTWFAGSEAY